jgi:hypothetical protein
MGCDTPDDCGTHLITGSHEGHLSLGSFDECARLGPNLLMIFSCAAWHDQRMEIVAIPMVCTNLEIVCIENISRDGWSMLLLLGASLMCTVVKVYSFPLIDVLLGIWWGMLICVGIVCQNLDHPDW